MNRNTLCVVLTMILIAGCQLDDEKREAGRSQQGTGSSSEGSLAQSVVGAGETGLPIARVESLLARELTIEQLLSQVGPPTSETADGWSWRHMIYELPGVGHRVDFVCKGRYVVDAWYGDKRIQGVSPITHTLRVGHDGVGRFRFWLDDKLFPSMDGLKEHLAGLPDGVLIEYLSSDVLWPGMPLQSREDIANFVSFCEREGLAFFLVPGG